MTRRVLIFAVLAAAVLGVAPASQAASVNARERAQQARLRQGLHSGALTGREYVRLEAQEARACGILAIIWPDYAAGDRPGAVCGPGTRRAAG